MITPSSRTDRVVFGLILVAGMALRIWGLTFGLPHDSARPDEEILVGTSLSVFSGRFNPQFFDWPSLWFYATAAAYAAMFAVQRLIGAATSADAFIAQAAADPTSVHLAARLLAASAGVATIAVLYGATREVCSRRTALIAAALLSVAFLHVRDSHFGLTDVPATFMAVCAFWAATRSAARGVTMARVVTAGLLGGLAASTKYNAALVLAPALVAIAESATRRRDVAWALKAVSVLLASAAVGFVVGTPYAVLSYQPFLGALSNVREHLKGGHGVDLGRGWIYHLTFTLRYGLGLPLLVMSMAGAAWLAIERSWRAALLLSFPIVYYATIGAGLTVFTRYMVPIVPFLCLTAACFVDRFTEYLEGHMGHAAGWRRAPDVAVVVLVAIAAGPTLVQSIAFDQVLARPDTRVLGAAWVERQYPSGAALYQTGASYGHVQPRPKQQYAEYTFNDAAGRFEVNGGPAPREPDIVVVSRSPLSVYSEEPPGLARVLETDYVESMTVNASVRGRGSDDDVVGLYDLQDAWYVPYSGFAGVRRPGPNLLIFVRRK